MKPTPNLRQYPSFYQPVKPSLHSDGIDTLCDAADPRARSAVTTVLWQEGDCYVTGHHRSCTACLVLALFARSAAPLSLPDATTSARKKRGSFCARCSLSGARARAGRSRLISDSFISCRDCLCAEQREREERATRKYEWRKWRIVCKLSLDLVKGELLAFLYRGI